MVNWKRLFAKQRENYQVKNGLQAGLIIGVLNAGYGVAAMLLAKEKLMKTIAGSLQQTQMGIDAEAAFLMSLVITPIINLGLLSILGVLFGILTEKVEGIDNWWLTVISIGGGLLWGTLLSTGAPQFLNIIIGVLSGLIFAAAFIWFSFEKGEEQEGEKE